MTLPSSCHHCHHDDYYNDKDDHYNDDKYNGLTGDKYDITMTITKKYSKKP